MTEYDGLLRAVLEKPFDDLPRLLMADWYDDHGQGERATLIRVGCHIAALQRARGKHFCRKHADNHPLGLPGCAQCHKERKAIDEYETAAHDSLVAQARVLTRKNRRQWFPGMTEEGVVRGWPCQMAGLAMDVRNKMKAIFETYPITGVHISRPDMQIVSAVGTGMGPSEDDLHWAVVSRDVELAFPTIEFRGVLFETVHKVSEHWSRELVNYGRSLAGLPALVEWK